MQANVEGGGVLNGGPLTAQDTSRITENQAAAGGVLDLGTVVVVTSSSSGNPTGGNRVNSGSGTGCPA